MPCHCCQLLPAVVTVANCCQPLSLLLSTRGQSEGGLQRLGGERIRNPEDMEPFAALRHVDGGQMRRLGNLCDVTVRALAPLHYVVPLSILKILSQRWKTCAVPCWAVLCASVLLIGVLPLRRVLAGACVLGCCLQESHVQWPPGQPSIGAREAREPEQPVSELLQQLSTLWCRVDCWLLGHEERRKAGIKGFSSWSEAYCVLERHGCAGC